MHLSRSGMTFVERERERMCYLCMHDDPVLYRSHYINQNDSKDYMQHKRL